MSERNQAVYVVPGQEPDLWLRIDFPFGMISPPTITLHRPLVGPVEFYHADSYRLPIPEEAGRESASPHPQGG
jgi:hypothetical protein